MCVEKFEVKRCGREFFRCDGNGSVCVWMIGGMG